MYLLQRIDVWARNRLSRVVKTAKPKASRGKSSETFLVGIGLKPSDAT